HRLSRHRRGDPHGGGPSAPAGGGAVKVVGKPTPLVDAIAKVTGRGVYTDDIKLPGMLVGKILRSPLAYARIAGIDAGKALALPGVRAVVTGCESEVRFGVLPVSHDETAMAGDRVRHIRDW